MHVWRHKGHGGDTRRRHSQCSRTVEAPRASTPATMRPLDVPARVRAAAPTYPGEGMHICRASPMVKHAAEWCVQLLAMLYLPRRMAADV